MPVLSQEELDGLGWLQEEVPRAQLPDWDDLMFDTAFGESADDILYLEQVYHELDPEQTDGPWVQCCREDDAIGVQIAESYNQAKDKPETPAKKRRISYKRTPPLHYMPDRRIKALAGVLGVLLVFPHMPSTPDLDGVEYFSGVQSLVLYTSVGPTPRLSCFMQVVLRCVCVCVCVCVCSGSAFVYASDEKDYNQKR